MHDYRILIGAVDWQHPQWLGEFYPDGLPEEWQLGFYGNEFHVVCVPASHWPDDIATVTKLLEQCGDSLAFLCELPLPRCDKTFLQENRRILQGFGPQLLGVMLPLAGVTAQPELTGLLAGEFRIVLDSGNATEPALQIADTEPRAGICWHGHGNAAVLQRGQLAVARIGGDGMSPREIRRVLEALLAAQDPERYLVMLVEGNPPSIEIMRQAQTMLDLL